jgi:NAD(P)-dependent dehydrogenase (short-subunit alcohol dehydrogenase family)
MLDRGWGRIVNVSSGIADHPGAMVGMNAYAATKAALEAHTLNLAAELAGSGVTVNVYRPGSMPDLRDDAAWRSCANQRGGRPSPNERRPA